ncbi:MAG: DNA-binding protein WhiA [Clostridia bacterium]|nr:DNA-binding protein WhiA [Clostridia bacterium]
MESFAKKVKAEITALNPKIKNCCLYSFLYGMTFASNIQNKHISIKTTFVENAEVVHEKLSQLLRKNENAYLVSKREILISSDVIRFSTIAEMENNVFKCQHCREHFFKGLFFSCGTINSPEKTYRLELVFSCEKHAKEIKDYVSKLGIVFNLSKRNEKIILYMKRCEMIENFLALMGASNAAFDLINFKIKNEVRNIANRATNCDSANINKSLAATQKYINAINEIIRLGHFEELSPPLQEVALVRIDNDDINLVELGKKFSPPISKSGVYHRLERILSFYRSLEEK